VQLEGASRNHRNRDLPAESSRIRIQVPVRHPSRIPQHQPFNVRAGKGLRSEGYVRLRAVTERGIRFGKRRLPGSQTPEFRRDRILRSSGRGNLRRGYCNNGNEGFYRSCAVWSEGQCLSTRRSETTPSERITRGVSALGEASRGISLAGD